MIVAASSPTTLWYLTRATGVVALLLLTAAVAFGVLSSIRWRSGRLPRFLVGGLHRNVTLIAIAFVFVHVVTTVADGYAPVGLRDAVIPFVSPYRPIWLGLGAVAFDLLLALVITSFLRMRLGFRMWRAVHWLAYASWPVALMHSLGTGSDARLGWMTFVGFASFALVAVTVLVRVARSEAASAPRVAAAAAAFVTPLAIFVWYQSGPQQRGWAARAGTPSSLLHRAAAAPSTTPIASTTSLPAGNFAARLAGTHLLDASQRRARHGRHQGARPGSRPRQSSPHALGPAGRGRRNRDDGERRRVRGSGNHLGLLGPRRLARRQPRRDTVEERSRSARRHHVRSPAQPLDERDQRIRPGNDHSVTSSAGLATSRRASELPAAPRGLPRLLESVRDDGRATSLEEHVQRYGTVHDAATGSELIAFVEASGLGGRGGASFPTGTKLRAVASQRRRPVVVVNGVEAEPASGKDRALLRTVPHLVLDGAVLAAGAVGAHEVIVGIGGGRTTERDALLAAIATRTRNRADGRVSLRLVVVPDGFVSGEETALIQFLNGGPAKPTVTPPRPFERGVGGSPTLVQNVETLAHLALIARFGPAWFRELGTATEPGTTLVTISGAVVRPGIHEIARGARLRELLAEAGGARENISAYLIGGYFGTFFTDAAADDLLLHDEGPRTPRRRPRLRRRRRASGEYLRSCRSHARRPLSRRRECRTVRALRPRAARDRERTRASRRR